MDRPVSSIDRTALQPDTPCGGHRDSVGPSRAGSHSAQTSPAKEAERNSALPGQSLPSPHFGGLRVKVPVKGSMTVSAVAVKVPKPPADV